MTLFVQDDIVRVRMTLFKEEFLEFVDSAQTFRTEGSLYGSHCKAFARECLMGHGDTVVQTFISNSMDT